MSAYLVTDKTMDLIVGLVESVPALRKNSDSPLPQDNTELGKLLLLLNHDALFQRYSDPIPEVILYTYTPREATLEERTRALNSWLYQCSEGDVPGRNVFLVMDRFRRILKGEE